MPFVRGLDNASIQLRARVTEEVQDRLGDTMEQSDWEPLITVRGRFEDQTTLDGGQFARYVSDTPAVFIGPDQIPDDLHETNGALPSDADWPYVETDWRVNVNHTLYSVVAIRERSLTGRRDVDLLQLELEAV